MKVLNEQFIDGLTDSYEDGCRVVHSLAKMTKEAACNQQVLGESQSAEMQNMTGKAIANTSK